MQDMCHCCRGGPLPKQLPPGGIAIEAVVACRCRCGGCSCVACTTYRGNTISDRNRHIYGGAGSSVDSFAEASASVNAHSLEARLPKNAIFCAPSLELLAQRDESSTEELARVRTEEYCKDLDDDPWPHFLSEASMPGDSNETQPLIFGPMELDGSMEVNVASTGSLSMKSSHTSALSGRSEAVSTVTKHVGAALMVDAAADHRSPDHHAGQDNSYGT